jgi:hypothetical protein
MKFNKALAFTLIVTLFITINIHAQQNEILTAQKPASESSKANMVNGINFKLSGDKSKLILLVNNQLEIWSTNSKRILLKKQLDEEKVTPHFEINYAGDVYTLRTENQDQQDVIEFFKIQENKSFLKLESTSDKLIDYRTKIRFNRTGDKFAILHRAHGVKIYEIKNNKAKLLKHISIKQDFYRSILLMDFEFSDDDKHFFIFKGKKERPPNKVSVIYQKWNLKSFELENEVLSENFGVNKWNLDNPTIKLQIPDWNLQLGLFVNSNYMQHFSRSKKNISFKINPNHKSYLEVYSAKTNRSVNVLSHKAGFIETLIINEETVATSDENRDLQIWNIKTGNLINSLTTNEIVAKEDFDIPALKALSNIACIQVNPSKKEIYYSLSGQKDIWVWNYEYNTNEIFESNIVKVSNPYFTSDSTLIYQKGMFLEHFDFKNQKIISQKKENNQNKSFSFKYNSKVNKGFTATDNTLKLWSINPLVIKSSFELPLSPVDRFYINEDFTYLVIYGSQGFTNVFSALKENLNKPLDHNKLAKVLMKNFTNKTFKINGDPVDSQEEKVKLFKIQNSSLKLIDEIRVPGFMTQQVCFVPSKNGILISMASLPISNETDNYKFTKSYLYNIKNKKLNELAENINGVLQTINHSNKILSLRKLTNSVHEVKIIDKTSLLIEKEFTLPQLEQLSIQNVLLLDETNLLLYAQNKTYLLNLETGNLESKNISLDGIDYYKKNDLIVTADVGISFYRKSFNKIYDKYYHRDNVSSITILPENNYYYSKNRGYELLSLLKDNKAYSFEQFDLKYHRPDLVIEAIKETISDSIYEQKEIYELAYKKRLQRVGKKEADLESEIHAPELTILNRPLLPNKTNKQVVELKISVSDSNYNLERMVISVNGILIRNLNDYVRGINNLQIKIPITLSNGMNKILLSVVNSKGASSTKEELEIEYVGRKMPSKLFVVSLGVSEYEFMQNTPNSANDALKLKTAFTKLNSREVNTLSLVNEQVSKNNLIQISSFLSQAGENDTILFFVSGHALRLDKEYYYCTSKSSENNISRTGFSYKDFDELLGNSLSRNRILILNTCFSGELYNAKTIKEIEAIDLMRKVFEDLKLTNGTTVISASEANKKFYENNLDNNGLITKAILHLIKTKNKIKVSEFCDEIIKYSKLESNKDLFETDSNKNIPLIRYNNIYNNSRIW